MTGHRLRAALIGAALICVTAGCGTSHHSASGVRQTGRSAGAGRQTASPAGRTSRTHEAGAVRYVPGSLVVTPRVAGVQILDRPNGALIDPLPVVTDGGPTWLPVLREQNGWYLIEQDGPPNGLTGWVAASNVRAYSDPWTVTINLDARTLTVVDDNRTVGIWPVAVGAALTPTPAGRTFIAADVAATGIDRVEAPDIRPLAWHTTSRLAAEEIGGTTIAIHGWEDLNSDPALFGQAVSHGCVRVPADGMRVVAGLPDGTTVLIVR